MRVRVLTYACWNIRISIQVTLAFFLLSLVLSDKSISVEHIRCKYEPSERVGVFKYLCVGVQRLKG